MRRIILALLVCLLPLQSFAGVAMDVKMASMDVSLTATTQMQMADGSQAPCHMASQPEQPASQNCCGLQGVCHSLCQVFTALPMQIGLPSVHFAQNFSLAIAASFQSADPRAGFKPPIL
jgi:hypothetical protein